MPTDRRAFFFSLLFVDVVAAYSNLSHPHKNLKFLRKLLESSRTSEREMVEVSPSRKLRRRLGSATIAEIIASYKAGASVRQLAQAHGTSSDAMLRLLKEEGVAMRYQSLTPEQVSEVIRLYEAGKSIYAIENETGIPKTSVSRALKQAGVPMRGRGGAH